MNRIESHVSRSQLFGRKTDALESRRMHDPPARLVPWAASVARLHKREPPVTS